MAQRRMHPAKGMEVIHALYPCYRCMTTSERSNNRLRSATIQIADATVVAAWTSVKASGRTIHSPRLRFGTRLIWHRLEDLGPVCNNPTVMFKMSGTTRHVWMEAQELEVILL